MKPQVTVADQHIAKVTKKYMVDFLNAMLFSNAVLWDGDDQFNELPIFNTREEAGYRSEQRGALLVDKQNSKVLRISVTVTESATQKVCYRVTGLKDPLRIDEGPRLYYPLDGPVVDTSISDLSLGIKNISSYSFSDNTDANGNMSNKKLFALLRHLIQSIFITIEDKAIFEDLIEDVLSQPPTASDPHFHPIFGLYDGETNWD
jgi:hypothetical protein